MTARRGSIALSAVLLVACGSPTAPPPGAPEVPARPPPRQPAPPPVSSLPRDEATLVTFDFPATLDCNATASARVVMRNSGTTSWTRAAAFRLGAVDDSDPLNRDGRVELPADVTVAPGDEVEFTVALRAPAAEGQLVSDWRMLQEYVRWFGETVRATVQVTCPRRPARAGRVRLQGRALVDDDGAFQALGATLFWAPWAYKHDRPKLEAALALLQQNGFHYLRALGVVGDPNGPDYWDGREIDVHWSDYDAVIAGLTDLAYDQYGLRVQWTLIGDGQFAVPTSADRYALADRFLAMSHGREHKLMLFEVANEAWQNGFPGSGGVAELRALTRYLNDRTDVLVAASAPDGHDCAAVEALYSGDVADVATIHFDRDVSKTEGPWRPVRQPWEHLYCAAPVGSNNEPIGPGSSVASETDPVRLNAASVATYVANIPFYVFHTRAGVRGDAPLSDMAGLGAFTALASFVPGDLSAWTRKNAHWADSPFRAFAGDASGTLHADAMWPDFGAGATSGAVRAYGDVADDGRFFVFAMGIKGSAFFEPRRPVDFDVIEPMTGAVRAHLSLGADERFELTGGEAFVLRGQYR